MGQLEWLDGNATNLLPLAPIEEARRLAELAGGPEALMSVAKRALAEGDAPWAAQLADHSLAFEGESSAAKDLVRVLFAKVVATRGVAA